MISHISNSFHKITRDKLEHGIIMVFDLWRGSTGKGGAAGGAGMTAGGTVRGATKHCSVCSKFDIIHHMSFE